jgi:hemolysin III
MEQALVPRLRGVFHVYAFFAAILAGVVLVALADGYLERFAVWVYSVALAAMFGASALYHRFPWPSAAARLASVWGGATLGVVLELHWIHAPRWVSAIAYLGVGWIGIIALPEFFPALGVAAAVLLIVGAGLYTAGALTYATTWPNPVPATFGFHEVFHLLVIAAAAVQFVALSLVVL